MRACLIDRLLPDASIQLISKALRDYIRIGVAIEGTEQDGAAIGVRQNVTTRAKGRMDNDNEIAGLRHGTSSFRHTRKAVQSGQF